MIRSRLRYHRPTDAREASAVLADHHGNVAVLGGGTLLLPKLNRGEVTIEHVVDLRDLALDRIDRRDGRIHVGARVTYAQVTKSELLRREAPLLPRMARGVTGGRQLTQQATLVGSFCQNFPSTEAPGALVALGAVLSVHGVDGTRHVPAQDFLLDANHVDLKPGEFVTSYSVVPTTGAGYCKIKHSTGSWPIATASAVPDPNTGMLSVTLGAVSALPLRLELPDTTRLDELVGRALTSPWEDVLAPGSYRKAVAPVAARRALSELLENTP